MMLNKYEIGSIYQIIKNVEQNDTVLCTGTPVIFIGHDENNNYVVCDCRKITWCISKNNIGNAKITQFPSPSKIKLHKIKKFISDSSDVLAFIFIVIGVCFALTATPLYKIYDDSLLILSLCLVGFGILCVFCGLLFFLNKDDYYNPLLDKMNLDELKILLNIQIKIINPEKEYKDAIDAIHQPYNDKGDILNPFEIKEEKAV